MKRCTAVRLASFKFVAVNESNRQGSILESHYSVDGKADTKNVVEIGEFLMGHKPEISYIYIDDILIYTCIYGAILESYEVHMKDNVGCV